VALRYATAAAGNALAVAGRRIAVGAALQDEVLARVFQTSMWGAQPNGASRGKLN
jgi:hypothetical protein